MCLVHWLAVGININILHAASNTENTEEMLSDMVWPGGQKFSG